jgi:hypothetical protein
MRDPYLPERQALIEAVTTGRGRLSSAVRTALVDRARGVMDGVAIPEPLIGFADHVARDATVIGNGDIGTLGAAGFDDEAVFETVVAAALGASLARLERVDELLETGG